MGAYGAIHPQGHPRAGKPCTNSATCIIVFCYANALGKVLLRGGPPKGRRQDYERLHEFLAKCMPDFLKQSREDASKDADWIYREYRCGFVHGFYPGKEAWTRKPHVNKYWVTVNRRLVLNVDELVRGFGRGLRKFREISLTDPDIRERFRDYILKQ
jgi:hypothetical protein